MYYICPLNLYYCLLPPMMMMMLITTCFSGYCLSEFKKAYQHNVTVMHKNRLIVLMMLRDLTDLDNYDVDDIAVLRQYLRQYTYIDYRADDWFDKLLYALPLRGLLQHNEDRNVQVHRDPNDDVLLQPNEDPNDDGLRQHNDNSLLLLDEDRNNNDQRAMCKIL